MNGIIQGILTAGGIASAVLAILALCGRPVIFFSKKREQQRKEKEAEFMENISKQVTQKLQPILNQIQEENQEQTRVISALSQSSKDMLRRHIMDIYHKYAPSRAIPETERLLLEDLYNDYHTEGGNKYISRKYTIMSHWDVIPDERDTEIE